LVWQKEAVGGDVQDAGRLHLLEGIFGGIGAGEQRYTRQFRGKGGGFGGGARKWVKFQLI
jgi:hypothetical protein